MNINNKIRGFRQIWQFDNRWHLIASRILFPREPVNILRIGAMRILEDHSAGDADGARNVVASPMYRQYLGAMGLKSPLNVLDLGANNGGFPLLLKVTGCALKRVVCVEMNPKTFSRLRYNIESNLANGFILLNAAVCGHPRELTLKLSGGGTGDSIYQKTEPGESGSTYKVKGMTFDEVYEHAFQNEIVDLCKMDIEGAEYEVFATPNHKNIENCRYLIIEIHDGAGREPERLLQKINELGFVEIPASKERGESIFSFRNTKMKP